MLSIVILLCQKIIITKIAEELKKNDLTFVTNPLF